MANSENRANQLEREIKVLIRNMPSNLASEDAEVMMNIVKQKRKEWLELTSVLQN